MNSTLIEERVVRVIISKWCQYVWYIGLYIVMILCVPGCQFDGQSVERIMQNNMVCRTVVQAEWGNDTGELGYVPESESSFSPRRPFRFQVNTTGNLFAADLHNERVLEFTSEGTLLRSFSVPISKSGEYIVDIAARSNRVAVASTDYVYVFGQGGDLLQILEWPVYAGQYSLCSKDMAGRKVQVDEKGNIYACGTGGFERGDAIVQFASEGHSHSFFEGDFDHFVVGWDGFIYIQQPSNAEPLDNPPDDRVLKFDLQGNQLDEIVIRGRDLTNAGLLYSGLLVAVDAKGNLYGNVVTVLRNGKVVPQEALVQIGVEGKILRIIEYDSFKRPAIDVVDREGNLYLWNFANVPSDPVEIWRCSP